MNRKMMIGIALLACCFMTSVRGAVHLVELCQPGASSADVVFDLRSGQLEWCIVRHPGNCTLGCLAIRYPEGMPFGCGGTGVAEVRRERSWGRDPEGDPWLRALSPMVAMELACRQEGCAFFWFGPLPVWEYAHPLILHFDVERREVDG